MSGRFEVTLEDMENDDRYRSTLRVVHGGRLILEETDRGEPEDNSFTRDWSWVPDAIKRAYALGVADGRASPSEGKAE